LIPTSFAAGISIAFLILIWGSTWAAIRIGLEGIPPFTGAFLRFVIASAVLVVAAVLLRVKLSGGRREWSVWIASGLLTFTGSYGVVYWTEQWVPSGLAAILFATFPLLVAAFARFLLPGEKLRPTSLAGIMLGFVGVVIIFSEDLRRLGGPEVGTAAGIFLLSPLCSALGNVLVKRFGSTIHPISLTAIPMMIGASVLGGCALAFERNAPMEFNAASVGSILYLAIVGTAMTFTLYFWLLSHMAATKLSLITYGTPVVAVLLGSILFEERITPRILAGAATVIAGVSLAGRK
jgi:drug/metabolite transporter (DMT)-like permease